MKKYDFLAMQEVTNTAIGCFENFILPRKSLAYYFLSKRINPESIYRAALFNLDPPSWAEITCLI